MLATTAAARAREKLIVMTKCEICENEYDKAFEVIVGGKSTAMENIVSGVWALTDLKQPTGTRRIPMYLLTSLLFVLRFEKPTVGRRSR